VPARTGRGYNSGMRHRPAPVRGALSTLVSAIAAALLLALVLAPAALADDRDPRCASWEQHGAPPGTDMAKMCPGGAPMLGEIGLADEPLVPYIVGLLVVAGVLGVFGLVAMRVLAPPTSNARMGELWPCAACGTDNLASRTSCHACHAPREPAPTSTVTPPA
jgi:hypothetical protein